MKVSLVQTDIKWADPIANQKAVESALISLAETADGTDLCVLPEMWSTGFATQPSGIAEEMSESTSLEWMKKMAGKYHMALCGSIAIHDEGRYYNRFFFVKPDGTYVYYDKRHLFTYGHEDETYTPGDGRVVVEWEGVRFLLQVCYDLRFPCFSRNDKSAPYDCIIYVASWPESRRKVWDLLLHARAVENQSFVIGVNRIGDDKLCHYNGGTMLVDAYGKDVAKADDDAPAIVTAKLDMERLAGFRKKFPVLNDAD